MGNYFYFKHGEKAFVQSVAKHIKYLLYIFLPSIIIVFISAIRNNLRHNYI